MPGRNCLLAISPQLLTFLISMVLQGIGGPWEEKWILISVWEKTQHALECCCYRCCALSNSLLDTPPLECILPKGRPHASFFSIVPVLSMGPGTQMAVKTFIE